MAAILCHVCISFCVAGSKCHFIPWYLIGCLMPCCPLGLLPCLHLRAMWGWYEYFVIYVWGNLNNAFSFPSIYFLYSSSFNYSPEYMNIIQPFFTRYIHPPCPTALGNVKEKSNRPSRTSSLIFKQSLPATQKFNSRLRLQTVTIRSYAMTSPTIKLNSGHQMPIVGFG